MFRYFYWNGLRTQPKYVNTARYSRQEWTSIVSKAWLAFNFLESILVVYKKGVMF